jgi:hypothetical protein
MKKWPFLLVSHVAMGAAGFVVGIYMLPILIAPTAPDKSEIEELAEEAVYSGEFRRDLQDSDALHWGDGTVYVGRETISFRGAIAPGPDYKLYLSPEFVRTEADFERLKPSMARVGNVETFENFRVPLPQSVSLDAFTTVIVWCESFGQFITAAEYR